MGLSRQERNARNNLRETTEQTETHGRHGTGFGQRDSVPSQLTVEAVVQFRQLLENDGKRTEIEMIFRSSQSFFCQWPFHQRFPQGL